MVKMLLSFCIMLSCFICSCSDSTHNRQLLTESDAKQQTGSNISNNQKEYKERKSCLPDSLSALKLGKKILFEKLGKDPDATYSSYLIGDSVWVVTNSYEKYRKKHKDVFIFGGGRTIHLRKQDCAVLNISITK